MSHVHRDETYAKSATTEITVHVLVFILALVPLLGLILPASLMIAAASIIANATQYSELSEWINKNQFIPLTVSFGFALTFGAIAIFFKSKAKNSLKLRDITGSEAAKLQNLADDMWTKVDGGERKLVIKWFPAIDIAAYAAGTYKKPELHISAGLWRACISDIPVATAILGHELAHLKYRDPSLINVLRAIVTGVRAALSVTLAVVLVAFAAALICGTGSMMASKQTVYEILVAWLLTFAAAATIFIFFPLGWFAIRRQFAFVSSLIEIRADVASATWTQGLRQFTQSFASNEALVPSTNSDLIRSIISPQLTHIPERQRLEILSSTALLVTPKIRFFAMSLLLAFLLPINFASPLLFGGTGNYLIMQSVAAAFNASIVAMIIVGQSNAPVRLDSSRVAALASASIVVTAMPRINLEPLSYLPMSWIAGFGGKPADLSTLPHDILITTNDLSQKFGEGLLNASALFAFGVALLALHLFIWASARSSLINRNVRAISAALLAIAASFIAGYDPFRSPYLYLPEKFAYWLEAMSFDKSLLLGLPLIGVAVLEALIVAGAPARRPVNRASHLV